MFASLPRPLLATYFSVAANSLDNVLDVGLKLVS